MAARYVIALGGNALIPPGGTGTAEEQLATVRLAAAQLAPPEPVAILEESEIRHLLEAGAVVVAADGGGVPVEEGGDR